MQTMTPEKNGSIKVNMSDKLFQNYSSTTFFGLTALYEKYITTATMAIIGRAQKRTIGKLSVSCCNVAAAVILGTKIATAMPIITNAKTAMFNLLCMRDSFLSVIFRMYAQPDLNINLSTT